MRTLYKTMYVVNAKGSGVGESSKNWTVTVDATIFTLGRIDTERYNGMAGIAEALSDWLCSEFGLHNATHTTVGSQVDAPVSSDDSRGLGIYVCELGVEDVQMAKGDYRSRRDIRTINAAMFAESTQHGAYAFVGGKIVPRVAFGLRMHVSETIRELISEGLRRYFARLAGRRSDAGDAG